MQSTVASAEGTWHPGPSCRALSSLGVTLTKQSDQLHFLRAFSDPVCDVVSLNND
jgi:hypothetical protein